MEKPLTQPGLMEAVLTGEKLTLATVSAHTNPDTGRAALFDAMAEHFAALDWLQTHASEEETARLIAQRGERFTALCSKYAGE